MINIDDDSNAIVSTSVVEVGTQGFEDIEIRNSNIMVTGIDNNYDVQVENLDELDITVAKKEYTITGDDIYIPQFYDDAPQWMKDLVSLVVDVSMSTNSTTLINDMNKMLQEFAVSYVPLNQYTQSILDLGNEDMRLNALLETLNSNLDIGLSKANAQIISMQMTKASKDEVVAQVIQTLAAQLSNPNSNLGATVVSLDQAIVDEQTARAKSFSALTASMVSTDGSITANAKILDSALAYVGIDKAGASTNTGLSAYLQSSNGAIGGADSKVANDIRVTAEGVESKWAYNSIVNVNGVYRKSGFGLTANNFSGGGTKASPYTSEFWIDATKLRFTNSDMTGRTAPFTIDASGTTPKIKFNGVVEFSNVSGSATHKSGTSSPILGATTDVEGSTYYNTSTKSGYIVSNGKWINNSSVTDTSGLAMKDMSNVTTIDGGKITTGSITANQIKAGTITATEIAAGTVSADRLRPSTGNTTVWQGGGLVSQDFNGTSYGNIGSPTSGFRLSSNAAGTSTDPNIYGAYIRGGTVEGAVIKGGLLTGTSLLVNNMVVQSEYSSIHYGKIMHYESKDNATTVYYRVLGSGPIIISQAEYDVLSSNYKSHYSPTKGTILCGGAFGPGSSNSVTVGLRANRVTSASSNIQCVFSAYMTSGNTATTAVSLYVNNNIVFTASEANWQGSKYMANFTVELRGNVLDPYKENTVVAVIARSGGDSFSLSYHYFAPSAIIYNM